jgi:hypothetical protein
VIEWGSSATLLELSVDVADEQIVEAAGRVAKLGIDCALGWPVEFAEFVRANAGLHMKVAQTVEFDGGMEWRRRLAYRETDRSVREQTGRWPLSVSTDRLGLTAMRCAGLLSRLQASGIAIDRSGAGLVVEVYPGASLRQWGFATQGYRASADIRARLLADLEVAAPWFSAGAFRPLMIDSCAAFDAVLAAFASRAAALGQYLAPTGEQPEQARVEGWIAVPTESIKGLF